MKCLIKSICYCLFNRFLDTEMVKLELLVFAIVVEELLHLF